MLKMSYIARPGQRLEAHLQGVGEKARDFASKIGLPHCGEILGLLHDMGKYSQAFQCYIHSIAGELNPDADVDYIDPKSQKGKIDHSTAGAQWVWNEWKPLGEHNSALLAQTLSLCIASHHSGLIDCLKSDGEHTFLNRMRKEDSATHYRECLENIPVITLNRIKKLANSSLSSDFFCFIKKITESNSEEKLSPILQEFALGMLTKFLFSCLIDADRLDSAFPNKPYIKKRVNWSIAIDRFERRFSNLNSGKKIDEIRQHISDTCLSKANQEQGIYTLTVPTGGGKTYATLRYALHHAKQYTLDRIIYIIPYTSIIEQNAQAIRKLIEDNFDEIPWVLEHHSNLEPENETWHSQLTTPNWDSPIVLTTMVQFLEVFFGSRTRHIRRLHQLANSVIIFDEIQTLPIKCIHLFCNALNFLVNHAKTTAILCTATQPLLNELRSPEKGQLNIPKEHELVESNYDLFTQLQRVTLINHCHGNASKWKEEAVAELALEKLLSRGNCLVIVNTKQSAKTIYQYCHQKLNNKKNIQKKIIHLSTHQCPVHRKKIVTQVKGRLEKKLPVLCISTQLIEAGVDIDFSTVIRLLAGVDSIVQAAGRCNRNAELIDKKGNVIKGELHLIDLENEDLTQLNEIQQGKEKTQRVLHELKEATLLSLEGIKRYFQYYFFDRANEMSFNISKKDIGYDTTLLNLLSNNTKNTGITNKLAPMRQSFMTAAKAFKTIEAPTEALIIPYDDKAKELIAELCRISNEFNRKKYVNLLKKAQRYSINVFPNVKERLYREKAIHEIQNEGIFYLDERYYSLEFGLSLEPVSSMNPCIV